MKKSRGFCQKPVLLAAVAACLSAGMFHAAPARAESVCAVVKIEIRQELTLERQAFDAHMKIENGLTSLPLENVAVEVTFSDEDGNPVLASSDSDNTDAGFFIRPDSEGISEGDNGTWDIDPVAPESSSDLHWLIIPAPGTADGQKDGKIYYVGARLTYTLGGEQHTTEVSPDYIFVKPLPQIVLDYFLTRDVYGDDAWTQEVEPPEPFTLGVRVKNTGNNTAHDLKIDSAQPEIVENEQGLLIDFKIEGSSVNGEPAKDSLLVEFGDVEPGDAAVGRWIMTCTLSGEFTDFGATVSHADELGGELTSLIRQEDVNTHFLLKDVLVDLPGKDNIRDFLATDTGALKVYESDNVDSDVADISENSDIELLQRSGSRYSYAVSTPDVPGFIYIKLFDPHDGDKPLDEATRSDGKKIDPANAWLSKQRKENPENGWNYFVNLFDVSTTGSYVLVFDDPGEGNQPPQMQFIPDKTTGEEQQVSFPVEATDPNDTVPVLSVSGLPAGADFTDHGDGSGLFEWIPAMGQAGTYRLTFSASDGQQQDTQTMTIAVHPGDDTDADGMKDDWERNYFGNLERDGTGDYDGDGISDLDEFLLGCNPTAPDHAPTIPVIADPADGAEVEVKSPVLTIENSRDPDGDEIFYEFELYSDDRYSRPVEKAENVPEGDQGRTSWQADQSLDENKWYYWRVRATDGAAYSLWTHGRFFVNTQNQAPGAFHISRPADGTEVDTLRPGLEVTNSTDPDNDAITYSFEIYTDSSLSVPAVPAADISPQNGPVSRWQPDIELEDGSVYYWRAVAEDEHGAETTTKAASFTINTANQAPAPPEIASPEAGSVVTSPKTELVVNNSTDANGDPLSYYFEVDTDPGFNSPEIIQSPEISEDLDTTSWQISGLDEDTRYFWRAKADDGRAQSRWAYGSFFVNTQNTPPSLPVIKNPGRNAWVGVLAPELSMHPARNPDADDLLYTIEICTDRDCQDPIITEETDTRVFKPESEFENNTIYYWRVLAADEHGQSPGWNQAAMFFVRQTNQDPVISGTPETTVYQDADYSFTPTAHDPDPGDQMTFSITNKPDWAQFDPGSGTLSGTPGNEHVGISTGIVITVTDTEGASASLAPFDIQVINVNDPPQAADDSYTIAEDSPLVEDAPGVLENDADVDAGDTLSAELVESTAHGNLNLNKDGSFSYIPEHNYYGEDSFTYVASDGTADSEIAAVNLSVTPVNDSPEVSDIEDAVISENTAVSGIGFTVSDVEDAAGDIEMTVSSDNPDLIPDENITVSGSDGDFTIAVIPVENRHGSALISVTATDSEGASTYITFTVEVAPKTDPPIVRYFILNPDLLASTLCVTSLEDGNHITAGSESLDLDQYESATISPVELDQGDAVSGTGHFSISGNAPETGMPVPEAFAGRHFVIPHLRGEHTYYISSPYGDSSVSIDLGNRTENISISKGEVEVFNAGNDNSISSVITADMPIVISHAAIRTIGCARIAMDAYPVAPAAKDLWGIRADNTHIGAMENNTTVTVLRTDGTREDHLLDAGSVMRVPRGHPGFLPGPGKPDRSVYLKADKPIAAVQKNRKLSQGATVLLESAYLARRYAIPMDARSITVVCPEADTEVRLHDEENQPVVKTCGTAGDTPASVDFRSRGFRGRISAGAYLESTRPVYVIFEPDNYLFEKRNLLGAGYPEKK